MTIKVLSDGSVLSAVVVGDEITVAEIEVTQPVTEAEVATMTTSKPANKGGHNNNYPFQTKAQILAQIQSSDDFMLSCLKTLYANQTADEREEKDTKYRNRRGFMSSHAVNGTKLAEKHIAGEALTEEDLDKARSITSRYGKQLAAHFRQERLDSDPSLSEAAKLFGVG